MLHDEQIILGLSEPFPIRRHQNIYLANIQVLRRAKNKDPLCVSRSARSVKDSPTFLVQELAVLDHDFIVLSFFLHKYKHGTLTILRFFFTLLSRCLRSVWILNTYWTKVLDTLAQKLWSWALAFKIDLSAFSHIKPASPNQDHQLKSSLQPEAETVKSEIVTELVLTSRRKVACFRSGASNHSSSEGYGRTGAAGQSVHHKTIFSLKKLVLHIYCLQKDEY